MHCTVRGLHMWPGQKKQGGLSKLNLFLSYIEKMIEISSIFSILKYTVIHMYYNNKYNTDMPALRVDI